MGFNPNSNSTPLVSDPINYLPMLIPGNCNNTLMPGTSRNIRYSIGPYNCSRFLFRPLVLFHGPFGAHGAQGAHGAHGTTIMTGTIIWANGVLLFAWCSARDLARGLEALFPKVPKPLVSSMVCKPWLAFMKAIGTPIHRLSSYELSMHPSYIYVIRFHNQSNRHASMFYPSVHSSTSNPSDHPSILEAWIAHTIMGIMVWGGKMYKCMLGKWFGICGINFQELECNSIGGDLERIWGLYPVTFVQLVLLVCILQHQVRNHFGQFWPSSRPSDGTWSQVTFWFSTVSSVFCLHGLRLGWMHKLWLANPGACVAIALRARVPRSENMRIPPRHLFGWQDVFHIVVVMGWVSCLPCEHKWRRDSFW